MPVIRGEGVQQSADVTPIEKVDVQVVVRQQTDDEDVGDAMCHRVASGETAFVSG